jgi:hypothetical protein
MINCSLEVNDFFELLTVNTNDNLPELAKDLSPEVFLTITILWKMLTSAPGALVKDIYYSNVTLRIV